MQNIFNTMQKNTGNDFWQIVGLFLVWRVLLTIFLLISINFVSLGSKDKFLGGGPDNYLLSPEIFSWANFDGEHYLSISIFGYKNLEQAFFPVYPALISIISKPFYSNIFSALLSSTLTGLIISNFSFLLALIILWELIRIDYSKKIALLTLLLLLFFPTSFFFGSVYSESLFLLLSVSSFYSARKSRWAQAAILGAVASATRVFGIILLPALAVEALQQKIPKYKFLWLILIPLGLFGYMYYQGKATGDPLSFYHLQTVVGEQHELGIVLLPQVFFRYVKMIVTVDITNPIYQTVILEFITGLIFLLLPVYGYLRKIRLSYLCFALMGFFIPVTSGSFSSLPRYVLVFFPSFLALSLLVNNFTKWMKYLLLILSAFWLFLEAALFFRGYWVA